MLTEPSQVPGRTLDFLVVDSRSADTAPPVRASGQQVEYARRRGLSCLKACTLLRVAGSSLGYCLFSLG